MAIALADDVTGLYGNIEAASTISTTAPSTHGQALRDGSCFCGAASGLFSDFARCEIFFITFGGPFKSSLYP